MILACASGVVHAQAPQEILDVAEREFAAGRLEASLERFDRLATLVPDVAPRLWKRGIVLYELGRFSECAAQFEAHHAVNPADAENAAWHFLCVARAQSPAQARQSLLAGGPDPRVMRAAIYELFAGRLTPSEVLAEAGAVALSQFYAHMYIGLYLEATGAPEAALPHLTAATSERYRIYGGFMNVVAQVHGRPGSTGPTGASGATDGTTARIR